MSRAFTVIFLATILIWILQSFDGKLNYVTDSADSLLASLGRLIAPIFKPLGFGDWRTATAVISGFMAKESVVSTLAVLVKSSATDLSLSIASMFSGLEALSFLVFCLLYTPCVAAVSTVRKEWGSFWGVVIIVLGQTLFAWLIAFIVYSVGSLLI
jgi:ferrous iron transport protein B